MINSILERIKKNNFWSFHGGINPPEQKQLTHNKPIRQLPLPKQLILPLQQHIGSQGNLLVTVGDAVLKGQALTQSNSPMEVPIHAPTSGIVTAIKNSVIAHPSGLSELCIFIDVDGEDKWIKRNIAPDYKSLSHEFILNKIASSGIAGMGGAGFPTHIKVNTKQEVNFLIINAVECEPYITADDLLIREQSTAIVDGIEILDHLLAPAFILIGIEDNKPEAIQALKNATAHIDKINVCVIPTKYPSGGEKQLIKILTGKEVESGSLPINAGIVMHNVATCFAISDAIINDSPLIRRVVTVTGQGLVKPQNVWALLGTTVKTLLEQCGFQGNESHDVSAVNNKQHYPVIMGGPMMGFGLSDDNIPVIKTTNCILAPSQKEMPSAFEHVSKEVECIRCGQCADVCPSKLLPQELQWSAKAKDYDQLNKLNLFDCIDCGACAYVCPSQIPLVQYYRVAKAEIRQQQLFDIKAEHAKQRFEARKLRLEKEKEERIAKHKKAAEARKAAMNKNTPEASGAKSAVAAALARVKAKKLASNKIKEEGIKDATPSSDVLHETQATSENNKAKVSAAVAKAKEKAKSKHSEVESKTLKGSTPDLLATPTTDVTQELTPEQNKKAKLAAAIAKAKAKSKAKLLDKNVSSDEVTKDISSNEALKDSESIPALPTEFTPEQKKKAKLAAAVAKAKEKANSKAKLLDKQVNSDEVAKDLVSDEAVKDSESIPALPTELTPEQKKKAKLAAAVAKAKEHSHGPKRKQNLLLPSLRPKKKLN